jgi:hypothetical protein
MRAHRRTLVTLGLSPIKRGVAVVIPLIFWTVAPVAHATTAPAQHLCDSAADAAAAESGVPVAILHALSRTETGRTQDGVFGPWPWTVNNAGDGHWFDDLQDALSHAERRRAEGATNLDIGCFQINLRWHGHAFSSLSEMFDPVQNARYAARFLSGLYREFGNWDAAVAAFHSRTPHFADRYMRRFHRIYAALAEGGPEAARRPTPTEARPPDAGATVPRALDIGRRPALLSHNTRGGISRQPPVQPLWEAHP